MELHPRFPAPDCKLSPMYHAKNVPEECVNDHAAALAKVLSDLKGAIASQDKELNRNGRALVLGVSAAFLSEPRVRQQTQRAHH